MGIVINESKRISCGSEWMIVGLMSFDSAYVTGGFPVYEDTLGLDRLDNLAMGLASGVEFRWDKAAGKIMCFGSGLGQHQHELGYVTEEDVAVVANVGTLANPVGVVFQVYSTGGIVTGPVTVVPSTQALSTGQCHVNYTMYTVTFLAADGVTTANVTYGLPVTAKAPLAVYTLKELPNGTHLSSAVVSPFVAVGL